tara:strand:+ start:41 stop:334 length:294 start_codon:yes stop_codon:yes gene_type:complete
MEPDRETKRTADENVSSSEDEEEEDIQKLEKEKNDLMNQLSDTQKAKARQEFNFFYQKRGWHNRSKERILKGKIQIIRKILDSDIRNPKRQRTQLRF